MKNSEIALLAGAAALLFFVFKGKAGAASAFSPLSAIFPKEIFNQAAPGQSGYGWQYFTDGTVIDPDGAYWKDNRIVWAPGMSEAI